MANKLFSFVKPSPTSMVASVRIARFLEPLLGARVLWDQEVATVRKEDTLFIVNGAFAFCKFLPELAQAVRTAKRLVWVQNDYTIVPPKQESSAESPFRAAFRQRAEAGLPPVDYWTTVMKNSLLTTRSRYVNWNSLTYLPYTEKEIAQNRTHLTDLFYYGSYRQNRAGAFRRYLLQTEVPVYISSPSDKFLTELGMGPISVGKPIKENFYAELASHGLGLYIEDEKSHKEFHSPANRFYEMLGAGLPMVFQPEAVDMLARAGIDCTPYVIAGPGDLRAFMRKRNVLGQQQRRTWAKPYAELLTNEVKRLIKEMK